MIRYMQQAKVNKRAGGFGVWHAADFDRAKRPRKVARKGGKRVKGLESFRTDGQKDSFAIMRVLLRDSKTRKYLRADHRWTKDPEQAQDFHHGWGAADLAFTMKPQRLVIVYRFGDERYDIGIPVQRSAPRGLRIGEGTTAKTKARSYRRHCPEEFSSQ